MFLRRIHVRGFRAAAEMDLTCEFPGRFSLLVGANNAGKSTIADALYLAHPRTFPQLPRPTVAVLGRTDPREIDVEFDFAPGGDSESALGAGLLASTTPAPAWTRQLERNLGQVRREVFSRARRPWKTFASSISRGIETRLTSWPDARRRSS